MTPYVLYRTTDPVNAASAQGLGEAHGLDVQISFPKDDVPQGPEVAALVVDLDFLACDARSRARVVGELMAQPFARPVAVHTYCVDDVALEPLAARGAIVARRLDHELFARVAAVIGRAKKDEAA